MAIHKLLRDLRETREGILGAALLATTAMGLACHSESAIEQGNRWRVREPHRAFEISAPVIPANSRKKNVIPTAGPRFHAAPK